MFNGGFEGCLMGVWDVCAMIAEAFVAVDDFEVNGCW